MSTKVGRVYEEDYAQEETTGGRDDGRKSPGVGLLGPGTT